MKITDIETILLSCVIPKEQRWICCGGDLTRPETWPAKTDAVIIKVTTSDRIVGIGECKPVGPHAIKASVDEMKPFLIGQDPFDVDKIAETVIKGASRAGCCHEASKIRAMAGINIALWDIIGKAVGKPVYQLIGGCYRSKIRAYASAGEWKQKPEDLAREACIYAKEGFTAFKMRLGLGLRKDTEMIRAVRDAVGDTMDLMVDNSCLYDVATAIRVARELQKYNVLFYEEPIPESDIDGYIRIRSAVDIPIAGGECLLTRYDMQARIERGAYDIVQTDCTNAGISESRKVAFMASLHGMLCVPHTWGGAVAIAANVHLAVSIPNGWMVEMDRTFNPMRTEIVRNPMVVDSGYVQVSKEPGLGLELNDQILQKFHYVDDPRSVYGMDVGFPVKVEQQNMDREST